MKFKLTFLFYMTVFCVALQAQDRADTLLAELRDPSGNYVFVIAHRGDWRNAPENSLKAVSRCIDMGVDMVEIDIRLTKDSIPVLMHDATVNRTTTGKGNVSDYTLEELKQFHLKDALGVKLDMHIPTLKEVVLLCKGKILINVDKAADYMNEVQAVLKATGTEKQIVYKGGKTCVEVRKQYGQLLDSIIYMPVISENTKEVDTFTDDFLRNCPPVAFEMIYSAETSPVFAQIQKITRQGSRVWVNALWPEMNAGHNDERAVDEPDACWGWIIRNGASMIQTDRPAELIRYLQSIQKRTHQNKFIKSN
ncbi:MAG: glycerophosphodiester phosphodiesterase family protein [Dysgonamonadaceae bacterium]|jgi:glycerophosphoryl diester phosphodiesterase|nr:glycerophosphodiester phosphodiesterase family protein [Dysgonamonadaceae bacterium]